MESRLVTLTVPAALVRQVRTVSHMGTKASLATNTPSGISAHETAQSVQTSWNRQVPETCQAGTRARQGVGHALNVQCLTRIASKAKDSSARTAANHRSRDFHILHRCCVDENTAHRTKVSRTIFSCRKSSHRVLHAAKQTPLCSTKNTKAVYWSG